MQKRDVHLDILFLELTFFVFQVASWTVLKYKCFNTETKDQLRKVSGYIIGFYHKAERLLCDMQATLLIIIDIEQKTNLINFINLQMISGER